MPFPIDQKYIHETETELGFIFPDKFKKRMIKENGGEILTEEDEWQIFPIFDKTDKKRISRTANHIVLETMQAREWDEFPRSGIAIGTNGFGDYLVLLPDENQPDKLGETIFVWFHETGELTQISNSIDELIDD